MRLYAVEYPGRYWNRKWLGTTWTNPLPPPMLTSHHLDHQEDISTNSNDYSFAINHENTIENIIFKMTATFSRWQWVIFHSSGKAPWVNNSGLLSSATVFGLWLEKLQIFCVPFVKLSFWDAEVSCWCVTGRDKWYDEVDSWDWEMTCCSGG